VVDDLHGAVALALFEQKLAKHDECMTKSDIRQLDPISLANYSTLQGPFALRSDLGNDAMLANLDVSPMRLLNIASQPPTMANKKSTLMFLADKET
jgi:hypothetical protein